MATPASPSNRLPGALVEYTPLSSMLVVTADLLADVVAVVFADLKDEEVLLALVIIPLAMLVEAEVTVTPGP